MKDEDLKCLVLSNERFVSTSDVISSLYISDLSIASQTSNLKEIIVFLTFLYTKQSIEKIIGRWIDNENSLKNTSVLQPEMSEDFKGIILKKKFLNVNWFFHVIVHLYRDVFEHGQVCIFPCFELWELLPMQSGLESSWGAVSNALWGSYVTQHGGKATGIFFFLFFLFLLFYFTSPFAVFPSS